MYVAESQRLCVHACPSPCWCAKPRNVNVISVFVSVCAQRGVFVFDPPPRPEAQADGQRICTDSSAGDLFDLSAYNTSGSLPAENLGSYLISQGETCTDRG